MKKYAIALTASAVLLVGAVDVGTAGAKHRLGRAVLTTAQGNRIGTVWFLDVGRHTDVRVSLNSGGLTDVEVDVFHGFHIHANGDPANGEGCIADPGQPSNTWFVSADGHYNPTGQSHGLHVGDMPVVYFNSDGSVETRFRLDHVEPRDIIGKAVVLHMGPDNFGNVPVGAAGGQYTANSAAATTATANTGNAGDRIACGVIH